MIIETMKRLEHCDYVARCFEYPDIQGIGLIPILARDNLLLLIREFKAENLAAEYESINSLCW